MDDDCDLNSRLEHHRARRITDRILRAGGPHALLCVNWFITHHADHALQELLHFSAELWAWEEEFEAIDVDRYLWLVFEDDHGIELPDIEELVRGHLRGLGSRPDQAVGYDSGDGV